jgi:phosphoribosylformylglycinamidine synthase subunit PurS
MNFRAEINIMPQKALLDPQGKTVHQSMQLLGLQQINDVRIGKHITIELEAATQDEANSKVEKACKELLANQVMEHYEFTLVAI